MFWSSASARLPFHTISGIGKLPRYGDTIASCQSLQAPELCREAVRTRLTLLTLPLPSGAGAVSCVAELDNTA